MAWYGGINKCRMQNAECRMELWGSIHFPSKTTILEVRIVKGQQSAVRNPIKAVGAIINRPPHHAIWLYAAMIQINAECKMQNAECRMQNGVMRLPSNRQIQTNIVENLGWRPLNSFGSTFPSIVGAFPCRCSHSAKFDYQTFPSAKQKKEALCSCFLPRVP